MDKIMNYFAYIQNGKIKGVATNNIISGDNLSAIEIPEDIYNGYNSNPEMYLWNGAEVIIDPEYEEKQAQKERDRINMLHLTSADVERGLYQAKGLDFDDILALVYANPPQGLDIKALKIELKANNFYRGNPYISTIGELLGITKEQLDNFFETNDWNTLAT